MIVTRAIHELGGDIRTRPPVLRTLPLSTWLTWISRATFGTSTCLALYMKALLRDMTATAETLLRSVMMSSVMPSLSPSVRPV